MVRLGRAIDFSVCQKKEKKKSFFSSKRKERPRVKVLTVIWRYLPIVVERPAPSSEEQNLHEHKSDDTVSSQGLNHPVLLQADTVVDKAEIILAKSVSQSDLSPGEAEDRQPTWGGWLHIRKSAIHEQETALDSPDGEHLRLFDDEDQLGAVLAQLDVCGREYNVVGRVDQVRRRVCQYVDDDEHASEAELCRVDHD